MNFFFSDSGSFLYSGGHECVLVKWLFQSQEPHFRPRLGSPIIGILPSADQTFTVTVHSDNSATTFQLYIYIDMTFSLSVSSSNHRVESHDSTDHRRIQQDPLSRSNDATNRFFSFLIVIFVRQKHRSTFTVLPFVGLHLFKRQRSIVTNSGKPGHLQFISIDDGKLVYQVSSMLTGIFRSTLIVKI